MPLLSGLVARGGDTQPPPWTTPPRPPPPPPEPPRASNCDSASASNGALPLSSSCGRAFLLYALLPALVVVASLLWRLVTHWAHVRRTRQHRHRDHHPDAAAVGLAAPRDEKRSAADALAGVVRAICDDLVQEKDLLDVALRADAESHPSSSSSSSSLYAATPDGDGEARVGNGSARLDYGTTASSGRHHAATVRERERGKPPRVPSASGANDTTPLLGDASPASPRPAGDPPWSRHHPAAASASPRPHLATLAADPMAVAASRLAGVAALLALVWTAQLGFGIAEGWSSVRLATAAGAALIWLCVALETMRDAARMPYVEVIVLLVLALVGAATSYWSYVDVAVLLLSLAGAVCLWHMPLAGEAARWEASLRVRASREDTATLGEWLTFSWLTPLINTGLRRDMADSDLWEIPVRCEGRLLSRKFEALQGSLLRRLVRANAYDVARDFALTLVSSVLEFAPPLFLKVILEAVDAGTPLRETYLLAVYALFAALVKSQVDLQHLYNGRRAAIRTRSELVSAIYIKSMKRRAFLQQPSPAKAVRQEKASRVAKSEASDADEAAKKGKEKKNGSSKAGAASAAEDTSNTNSPADLGRIVSLMATDAHRISIMFSSQYFTYSSVIQMVVAGVFLYSLLGASAFVGFATLVFASPIQSVLVRRIMKATKQLSAARDRRLSKLAETYSSIRFIRYLAMEPEWTRRVTELRDAELRFLARRQNLSAANQLTWAVVPSLVSCLCFASYIYAGHRLSAAVAFPTIAVISSLRGALNLLPNQVNENLSTKVAIDRIEEYLGDGEVSDEVSWLKMLDRRQRGLDGAAESPIDTRLGFQKATVAWPKPPPAPHAVSQSPAHTPARASPMEGQESGADAVAAPAAAEPFKLRDLDIEFPSGATTLVVGATASGKSSLLLGLLGEMTLEDGRILLPKDKSHMVGEHGMYSTVAYCAQTPWLQHASVRDNILFGSALEVDRYERVLDACALRPDLAQMPASDLTEIGERGISLSGGQKARVALARAAYSRSQVVLVDDPLAAVDSHTAEKLVTTCLAMMAREGRTVVLVTHHAQLALTNLRVDMVVVMREGRIAVQGHPSDPAVREVTEVVAVEEDSGSSASTSETSEAEAEEEDRQRQAGRDDDEDAKPHASVAVAAQGATTIPEAGRLVQEERRALGATKWSTYAEFMRAAGWMTIVVVLVSLVARQTSDSGEKFYLSFWGNSYDTAKFLLQRLQIVSADASLQLAHLLTLPSADEAPGMYLAGFVAIQVLSATFVLVAVLAAQRGSRNAGRVLFERALSATLHATSRFIDTTPSGRVLNTFSRDVQVVDEASSWRSAATYVTSLVISVGVVLATLPAMLLPSLLLAYLNYRIAVGYVRTARSLRRIEAASRSPIFSAFAELLNGVVTVRAACAEHAFLDIFFERLNRSLSAWSLFWSANRWCLVRLDWVGALATFCASLVALAGGIPSGLAGVALTTIQTTVMSCYWLSRLSTNLEQDANSIERVLWLISSTPQEPAAVVEHRRPPIDWPKRGEIRVEGLTLRYAPQLDPVLRDVSFQIHPGEKIGVVGRTGSGKSTLALAFFRFVEFDSGRIFIDDVDISQLGLRDLRSKITIIPQDAVLFSGTLRDNLDPLGEHADAELYGALHAVNIRTAPPEQLVGIGQAEGAREDSTDSGPGDSTGSTREEATQGYLTLDTTIIEGGQNLSQGQRQLVALARALLRRSQIVICDEATSSVDLGADEAVQSTLRHALRDATVVTIAHRLATVLHSDRVLVMDGGRVAEMGEPATLLRDETSLFGALCRRSGDWAKLREAMEGPRGAGA